MNSTSLPGPLFGWMMGAVGADGDSDATYYRELLEDAELTASLGYDAGWLVEHHFSDYFPTPSPLLMLANIAARCPNFGLGTAVIVTPWHHPLRLAEELAMLTLLTDAPLRIGLGRGNAPLEYEAFGVPMAETKDRFEECWDILRLAFSGKPFTYHGKHLQVPREVTLRPTPRLENVTFLGAIGQASSAARIADLGLAPMLTGHSPLPQQQQVLAAWEAAMRKCGGNTDLPKLATPTLIMAETDAEALALTRRYLPRWYEEQVRHYAFDAERYADLPTYQPFTETHKRRQHYCNPDNLGPIIESSLIGSAETVRRQVERYLAAGYTYILAQPSLPGLPHHLRQDWLTRFGRDVMPHFRERTRPSAAAADSNDALGRHQGNWGETTMKQPIRRRDALSGALLLAAAGPARAQAAKVLRIGVLTDMSGVAVDDMGPGSVLAAQMAAEDFGGSVAGMKIETIAGDDQQKPDIGVAIARRWFDEQGVDVIADVPNSSVGLAINQIARDANKVFMPSSSQTLELTGAQCSPNTVRWTIDTWATSHSLPNALMKDGKNRTWFFLRTDNNYGQDLTANATRAVEALGGRVVDTVAHPVGTTDMSAFVVRAQSSGADVIGLATYSQDLTTFLKQASEFGLMKGKQNFAGFVLDVNNVRAVGLSLTQGLYTAAPFYWDLNDGTRAFAKRFVERHPRHLFVNEFTAGVYGSVTHYLKAVAAVGGAQDGRAVVARMKQIPTDDPLHGKGMIRVDGSVIHPIYLFRVKSPAESRGDWDFFNPVATIPGEQAFGPLNPACSLVGKT